MQMLAGLLNAASTAYHVPPDQSHFACNDVAFGLPTCGATFGCRLTRDSIRKIRNGAAKLSGQRDKQ